ncbi:MAG: hypothetical protein M3P24_01530, partial [Gemmatimonadota bacterium]|nr:hypothetical protein [Gemmatimonadota bacterium]
MSFPLVFTLAASLHAASGPLVPSDTTLPADPIVRSPGHAIATPRSAGLSISALLRAETAVVEEARRGGFPGAALAVGRRDMVVMEQGIGRTGWGEADGEVDPERTVYD